MDSVDLNLLVALDALLAAGSVTGAARRLGLSTSAMSRTLTRLRTATGDPLLVRAGRGLVPTPHATALRARVHELTRDVQAVLGPSLTPLDVASIEQTFTISASEAFLAYLSPSVVDAVFRAAPRVRLRFTSRPDRDARLLREGRVDLAIGRFRPSAPEVRARALFTDRLVGVARAGHPLLSARVTARAYAACRHVVASRTGDATESVDEPLERRGLRRVIHVVVPGYPDAMRLVRHSDLLALVPRSCLGHPPLSDPTATSGLASFDPPVPTPDFTISAMWHPRLDADPAHRWLRDTVRRVCRAAYPRR